MRGVVDSFDKSGRKLREWEMECRMKFNFQMDKKIQKYLRGVAKRAIAEELGLKRMEERGEELAQLARPEGKDAEILNEKRGVFVTLMIEGRLRGCIGNIKPVYPLEEGVRRNAVNAAFEDPRFAPLSREEFEKIEIEISVLSVPKKLEYLDSSDLLEKLRPDIDGVVIKKGFNEATYLPQVWEQVPGKEQFLGSLCMKAGLPADEWESGELKVFTYQAAVF